MGQDLGVRFSISVYLPLKDLVPMVALIKDAIQLSIGKLYLLDFALNDYKGSNVTFSLIVRRSKKMDSNILELLTQIVGSTIIKSTRSRRDGQLTSFFKKHEAGSVTIKRLNSMETSLPYKMVNALTDWAFQCYNKFSLSIKSRNFIFLLIPYIDIINEAQRRLSITSDLTLNDYLLNQNIVEGEQLKSIQIDTEDRWEDYQGLIARSFKEYHLAIKVKLGVSTIRLLDQQNSGWREVLNIFDGINRRFGVDFGSYIYLLVISLRLIEDRSIFLKALTE